MSSLNRKGIDSEDLRSVLDRSKGAKDEVRADLIDEAFRLTPKIRSRVRNYIAPELTNPVKKLDARDQAIFRDELNALQGQLNVAKRNKDIRGLEKVRRKINNSAPPGTAKGVFYAVKLNRESDPRKLDFSNDQVKETNAYKAWLTVFNNAENAVL